MAEWRDIIRKAIDDARAETITRANENMVRDAERLALSSRANPAELERMRQQSEVAKRRRDLEAAGLDASVESATEARMSRPINPERDQAGADLRSAEAEFIRAVDAGMDPTETNTRVEEAERRLKMATGVRPPDSELFREDRARAGELPPFEETPPNVVRDRGQGLYQDWTPTDVDSGFVLSDERAKRRIDPDEFVNELRSGTDPEAPRGASPTDLRDDYPSATPRRIDPSKFKGLQAVAQPPMTAAQLRAAHPDRFSIPTRFTRPSAPGEREARSGLKDPFSARAPDAPGERDPLGDAQRSGEWSDAMRSEAADAGIRRTAGIAATATPPAVTEPETRPLPTAWDRYRNYQQANLMGVGEMPDYRYRVRIPGMG